MTVKHEKQSETKQDLRPYQAPKVVVYGDVRDLTSAGSAGKTEKTTETKAMP